MAEAYDRKDPFNEQYQVKPYDDRSLSVKEINSEKGGTVIPHISTSCH